MTDLERAREILAGYPLETAQYVIAEALAAVRREGAAAMRERAAAKLMALYPYYGRLVAALPLTPEEPT